MYLARGTGYTLFLTRTGAVILPAQNPVSRVTAGRPAPHPMPPANNASPIRLSLAGANPAAQVSGLDPLAGRVNYLTGRDATRWRTGVPTYDRVKYAGVYRGIDLVFYGSGRTLECDFIVAPGADPGAISLLLEGANARLDDAGDVTLRLDGADLTLKRPAIYQKDANGKQAPVEGRFVLASKPGGTKIGFGLASYDHDRPLVIDPQLVYSTYLSGSQGAQANAIAVDANGLVYVAGETESIDFALTQNTFQTPADFQTCCTSNSTPSAGATAAPTPSPSLVEGVAFVSVLNPAASGSAQLVYSTFLGGKKGDTQQASAVAVDSRGFIYVGGDTYASDFPLTSSAFQSTELLRDAGAAFVSILNPAASGSAQLVYSTYLTGSSGSQVRAVAVDSSGLAYVAGTTGSIDFPVTSNALATVNKVYVNNRDAETGFVSILDPSQSGSNSLVYSSYLGGSTQELVFGIALGPGNAIYVAGTTESTDFPVTRSAFQSKLKGSPPSGAESSAFLTVLNPTQSAQLVYSTILGGSMPAYPDDQGNAVAVDSKGLAYVSGAAQSTDFPVTSAAIQRTNKSNGTNAFVSVLDPAKSGSGSLVFSTYLGGSSGGDQASGIAVDSRRFAYLTGTAFSADFPITKGAFEVVQPLNSYGAFVSVIDPGLSGKPAAVVYSTYLGGAAPGATQGGAIAVGSSGIAYVTGNTNSTSLPLTPNALQTATPTGMNQAFVALLDPSQVAATAAASLKASPATITFASQFFGGGAGTTSPAQTVSFSYTAAGKNRTTPINLEGIQVQDADATVNSEFALADSGTTCAVGLSLAAGSSCTVSMTFTPRKAGARSGVLTIADNASNGPQKVALAGKGVLGPLEVSPAAIDFGSVPIGARNAPTSQFLTLTNPNPGIVKLTASTLSDPHFRFNPKSSAPNCNGSVPANSSCQMAVLFKPTTTGKVSATLTLTEVAANSPQIVKLTGVGLPAIPAPTPIPR